MKWAGIVPVKPSTEGVRYEYQISLGIDDVVDLKRTRDKIAAALTVEFQGCTTLQSMGWWQPDEYIGSSVCNIEKGCVIVCRTDKRCDNAIKDIIRTQCELAQTNMEWVDLSVRKVYVDHVKVN